MEVKLYVGNLNDATTEQELQQLFAQAGSVASINLIQDKQTGQARVFAYVSMASRAEAQTAISMFNAYSLADHTLIVKTARTRNTQGRDSSRLSAFASPTRRKASRPTKNAGKGFHSRLSAFGTSATFRGAHRRGGSKPD